jgi:hypothetical protein
MIDISDLIVLMEGAGYGPLIRQILAEIGNIPTGGPFLPLTGGTMSGPISVNGSSGSFRETLFQTNNVNRWAIGASVDSETGNNTGSSFILQGYGDNGSVGVTSLSVSRSSGQVSFSSRPIFGSQTPWDSGNFTPSNYVPISGTPTIYAICTFNSSPQVPTVTYSDNSTNAANTAFVTTAVNNGIGMPFDVINGYTGPVTPPKLSASQIMFNYTSNRDVYFVPVFCWITMITVPTSAATFSVLLNNSSIGTFTISTLGETTWNLTGNYNNNLPVLRGQNLLIQAPSTQDSSLAGVSLTMSGYNTATLDH